MRRIAVGCGDDWREPQTVAASESARPNQSSSQVAALNRSNSLGSMSTMA